MSLLEGESKTFPTDSPSPCDIGRFPGACFRSKKILAKYTDSHVNFCSIFDDYHSDGCVYGISFSAYNKTIFQLDEFCSRFEEETQYILCVDGFLGANQFYKYDNSTKDELCKNLKFKSAENLCLTKYYVYLDDKTAQEKSLYSHWEFDLLERNYDPSAKPKPAQVAFVSNN